MKYCSTCGKELADADLFCGSCGTKCENPVPQQAPAQEPPIYQQPYQDIYQQQVKPLPELLLMLKLLLNI